jgi:hypothetical protein
MSTFKPFYLDQETLEDVMKAIRQRDKIKAVQIVVKASHRGLKDSKDYVDELWAKVHNS